jgi:hypothetical protein
LAFSILAGAFLLNALCGINSGDDKSIQSLHTLVAFVINKAFEVVRSILVSSSCQTAVPAGEVSVALAIAFVQDKHTSSVVEASFFLGFAEFEDTFFRTLIDTDSIHEGQDFWDHADASIGLSALGDIDGGLASLSWKTESPA